MPGLILLNTSVLHLLQRVAIIGGKKLKMKQMVTSQLGDLLSGYACISCVLVMSFTIVYFVVCTGSPVLFNYISPQTRNRYQGKF